MNLLLNSMASWGRLDDELAAKLREGCRMFRLLASSEAMRSNILS